jgi:ComF family protein
MIDGVLRLMFPPKCSVCGALGAELFCAGCAAELEIAPLRRVPLVRSLAACWRYAGPIPWSLHRLKYEGAMHIARGFGLALAGSIPKFPKDVLMLPMPASPESLRKRGFNQVREILRGAGVSAPYDVLRRVPGRTNQVGLSRSQRLQNLLDAFRADGDRVRGRHVVLVDDVVTTGATLHAAAESLLASGALRVDGLVVATVDDPGE